MHTCVCIHECVFISMYMNVHSYMCRCMHMCVYVHIAIPSPILKLASLALHPTPILKSFLRLGYMYFILRNSIFEYWEKHIFSQHTIGLLGHHRPANETNILMVIRWRADSGSIYRASSPEHTFRDKDQVIYQLACVLSYRD